MNKILLTSLFLMLCICNTKAQKYVVYKMDNKINLVTKKGMRRLHTRDKLMPENIILIPYNTTLELFDKENKKKYIIKTPGKGSINDFIKDNRNETIALSTRLFKFMVSWMTGKTELRGEGNSDPGTITREEGKDTTVIIIEE